MKRILWVTVISLVCAGSASGQRAPIPTLARDPYAGAIVVDAADGMVLFEDRADAPGYPASMLKLMGLLLVLEDVEAGRRRLDEPVTATAEAASMGGSQVYLREHEVFPLDELLYAMMIQSANDAAAAVAIHCAGSRAAFVERMNRRAAELGMTATRFYSVHGLPPAAGQSPDVTTARDFARLCLYLARRPAVFRYTSVRTRPFRGTNMVMQSHNNLLGTFPGCDGFKTGYFRAAGYSIAATAQRDGARVIAVVMGSTTKEGRDRVARELLNRGLASAKRPAAGAPASPIPQASTSTVVSSSAGAAPLSTATATVPTRATPSADTPRRHRRVWPVLLVGAAIAAALVWSYQRQQWGR
ncbi:MAG: serine hydrolase [Kiritimatiellae bacterium]|nr:serine hydrolase [Kiritimatiellia bacterium]